MSPSSSNLLTLPHAPEAEAAVLGAIIKDPGAMDRVGSILTDEGGFYSPKHQMIYRAALDLAVESEPVDITTLITRLQDRGDLDKIGGRVYLVELADLVASTANLESYATTVREKAIRRRIISTCNRVVEDCHTDNDASADQILDRMQQSAFEINQLAVDDGFSPLCDDNDAWLKRVDDYQSGLAQKNRIMTGFSGIDSRLHGLAPTELVIIAGDTGQGKTQLALQIVRNVAFDQGKNVAVLSLEMATNELNARIQCAESRVPHDKIETPHSLAPAEMDKLVLAASRTRHPKIWVSSSIMTTPASLLSHVRRLRVQRDIRLLVVDYLQLMDASSGEETRERVVSGLARWMKVIAKELGVVVICLSQITAQEGKAPGITSLRESRAIGHHADQVLFVYHSVEGSQILIRKNRRGPSNKALAMRFEDGQWYEITERQGE
jgi:replicative DNA helicase